MIIPRVVRRKTQGKAEFACEPCVSRAAAGLLDSCWVNQEAGVSEKLCRRESLSGGY